MPRFAHIPHYTKDSPDPRPQYWGRQDRTKLAPRPVVVAISAVTSERGQSKIAHSESRGLQAFVAADACPRRQPQPRADGNPDRSAPISAATVSAVSTPMVGIASRSTPSIRFGRSRSSRSRPLRAPSKLPRNKRQREPVTVAFAPWTYSVRLGRRRSRYRAPARHRTRLWGAGMHQQHDASGERQLTGTDWIQPGRVGRHCHSQPKPRRGASEATVQTASLPTRHESSP